MEMKFGKILMIFMAAVILILPPCHQAFAFDLEKLPDANAFIYPAAEVKFIDDFNRSYYKCTDEVDFIDGFFNGMDIKRLKSKYYFYEILFSILLRLNQNPHLMERKGIKEFIADAENSRSFNEGSTIKKIKAWLYLISTFGRAKISWKEKRRNIERGNRILLDIIENNKQFRPIATMLLIDYVKHGEMTFQMKLLKNIIDDNIYGEYCAEARLKYAQRKLLTSHTPEEWKQAEDMCQSVITGYENFYTGYGDLYSDAYRMMLFFDQWNDRSDEKRTMKLKRSINKKSFGRITRLAIR